jgi:predicted 3-demethylubiquinone-9 3-methyltransferase (glyoxalase superfamily)
MGQPGPAGSVATVEFKLEGRDYVALNGPLFPKRCRSSSTARTRRTGLLLGQAARRRRQAASWLKDKYDFSWQVVPIGMTKFFTGKDKPGAARDAACSAWSLDLPAMQRAVKGSEMKYLYWCAAKKNIQTMDDHECPAFDQGLRAGGKCIASEALQPVNRDHAARAQRQAVSVGRAVRRTKGSWPGSAWWRRATWTADQLASRFPCPAWAASRCGRCARSRNRGPQTIRCSILKGDVHELR